MSARSRRIGIIGVGFGAQVHVPGFRSEGWEVAGIASRRLDKARKAADEAGIEFATSDPYELISRPDLAAVAITTPPRAHRSLALAALEAGKHVLCEKPFAIDANEAAEMHRRAERSGLTAMVCHEFRHTPQRAYVRQLLDDGYIGAFRLCTVEVFIDRYVTPEPRTLDWNAYTAEGGGTLGMIGSHYVDGLRYWFGDAAWASGRLWTLRPDLIDTSSGRIVRSQTDDAFTFTLGFLSGGAAVMTLSLAATPSRGARIVVMGDEGTLVCEQSGPVPLENGVVLGGRGRAPIAELPMPAKYTALTDPRDYRLAAFRGLVRDFGRGIERGISPAPNFADGWRCQQVIDAVRLSSASGRVVDLT